MSDSILKSVKKQVHIHESNTVFDDVIIVHINTVFNILEQLGFSHAPNFSIEDDSAVWSDYTGSSAALNLVKSIFGLRVRLYFDPPATSFVIKAIEDQIKELEWRLNLIVDGKPTQSSTPEE